MKDVRPCPYCGGEVEVVKLVKKKQEKKDVYRIECKICHRLVVRGIGFPCETVKEAEERIKQYEAFIAKTYSPIGSTKIRQSQSAKDRDQMARYSSRIDPENEFEC